MTLAHSRSGKGTSELIKGLVVFMTSEGFSREPSAESDTKQRMSGRLRGVIELSKMR